MQITKSIQKVSSYFTSRIIIPSRKHSSAGCITGIPTETADTVVIGAGVVGLSIARELALKGRDVLIVESGSTFGTGTSSRNSEVIHAGIYYPFNSFKARFCIRGKELLYKYCIDMGIPHKQLGKLIVATSDAEIPKLENLMRHGITNGVEDLKLVESSEAMKMEPELQCVKALLSPSTGIVDSHLFMLSLLKKKTKEEEGGKRENKNTWAAVADMGEAENSQATISYNTTVIGGHIEKNRLHLHITDSKSIESHKESSPFPPQLVLIPRAVINSAGLSAIPLGKKIVGIKQEAIPTPYYARGCYFTLSKTKTPPFNHLIYPMPEDGGIGVHVTLDLNGAVKFGPNVEWINGPDDTSSFLNRYDYSVNAGGSARFYPEIRRYFPNLKDESLEPGYSGIRAKLCGPKQPIQDFVIQGEDVHGVPGLVNLFGIESPGLTSSLAIAEYIATKLSKYNNM